MAHTPSPHDGSWFVAEQYLERNDPAFVDEVRRLHDADRLGALAARWYGQPAARPLILDYLDRPLNAYRHEALVKRLYKLSESAGDDTVLAAFLVAFDRSVRRVRRQRVRWDYTTRETYTEEHLQAPKHGTLPRPDAPPRYFRNPRTGGRVLGRGRSVTAKQRLFSLPTRYYLRRRAWRYFRKLGKQHPERYVPAMVQALKRYTDADVADGLALLDNWGLVHVLFHHSPALLSKPNGWVPAEGHTLAELAAAPIYEALWQAAPGPLIELLKEARARAVRQWTIQMLKRHHADAVSRLPVPDLLAMLGHEDPEVSALAGEALRNAPGLDLLDVGQWLGLIQSANPMALDLLCGLMERHLNREKLTLAQALKLATSRPLPVARLGLNLLQGRKPATLEECRSLLTAAEAEAVPVRADLLRWVRATLGQSPHFDPLWVLEFLDSPHDDVREQGWAWFQEEQRARENVVLWQRLLESPYDDMRLHLVAELEKWAAQPAPVDRGKLDADLVRYLWAAVLLNIHRGGRTKPLVVSQVLRRLERKPEEAAQLLPVLSVALRSVRGPEWRAGLTGVVQLVERRPEMAGAVRGAFPELKVT